MPKKFSYKKYMEEFHADNKRQAEVAAELMAQLPELDFRDFGQLIDWMDALTDPSGNHGVKFDWQLVVDTFAQHGFYPGVNTGADFDGNDAENSARYLLGQALRGLVGRDPEGEFHYIDGRFHDFAEDWRRKFRPLAGSPGERGQAGRR